MIGFLLAGASLESMDIETAHQKGLRGLGANGPPSSTDQSQPSKNRACLEAAKVLPEQLEAVALLEHVWPHVLEGRAAPAGHLLWVSGGGQAATNCLEIT